MPAKLTSSHELMRSLNNNLYKTRLLMYVLSSEELRKANQRVTFLSGAPLVAANEYLE